ncbi:PREDICTED: interferon lambda-1-like [Condylura cristata]|uniref:interferon lambda-1-like n=1 Tax=Condylura cristata TaxID=143302 RepID=UPI0003345404|nr:PREDICTED: interferon lambda-1-like [Condylura cristata]
MALTCTWLTVVVMVAALASAGPVPTSKPITNRRNCRMSRFQSLSPRELDAFRKARNALEESLSTKNRSCASHPFPKTRALRHLQVWERPVALEAELDLTLKVLGALTNTSLGAVLDRPLHTLHRIHTELQACVPAPPTASPRPQGRLQHWLHRLQEAWKKESQSCLETSVMYNLFRLLTQDLKYVTSGHLRV